MNNLISFQCPGSVPDVNKSIIKSGQTEVIPKGTLVITTLLISPWPCIYTLSGPHMGKHFTNMFPIPHL